jgi:hypothetical protein
MSEILPLKWAADTHRLLRPTTVNFDLVPQAARSQARRLVSQLGEDAKWVKQPLAHTLSAPRFNGTSYGPLIEEERISRPPIPCFEPRGWVKGLEALAAAYSEIPVVLWDTLAIMGLRPRANEEEAIPKLGWLLRHPWSVSDAALHGAAKATALWADICHVLEYYSGRYPEHGCGCQHILRALPRGASFPKMPEDRRPHVTREWWEHFLAEVALIHVFGFPFALHERGHYEGTMVAAAA